MSVVHVPELHTYVAQQNGVVGLRTMSEHGVSRSAAHRMVDRGESTRRAPHRAAFHTMPVVGVPRRWPVGVVLDPVTAESFDRSVAAIPPPLSIGTIALADGTSHKGFLCEPVALAGAADISGFGGWRADLDSVSSFRPRS